MKLFPNSSGLEPITKERIRHALESQGWAYQVDDDGDISTAFDEAYYIFLIFGREHEIFTVRGTWFAWLNPQEFGKASEFCAKWNKEKLWPKVYPQVDVNSKLRLHAEHNVDYESGLTSAQLLQHIRTIIASGSSFFEQAREVFPEAITE